ncbi:MAG: helix-turn-helix domain-containing protein, partial [Pseudonocardiaceae bacterium]
PRRDAMSDDPAGQVSPGWYHRAGVREILAGWDIAALYRVLQDEAGLSQRQIAARTGQQQSEVAEILSGRQVENHRLLRRIAAGLDVTPGDDGPVLVGPGGHLSRAAGRLP